MSHSSVTSSEESRADEAELAARDILARLRRRSAAMRSTTANDRLRSLDRLRTVLLSRRQDIYRALRDDFGKPALEVDTTEIIPVLNELRTVRKNLVKWMRPVRKSSPLPLFGTSASIHHEPRGVVLIISPWNYPVNLSLSPLISAVAAGNCALIKPSEYTPYTSELIGEIVAEAFDGDVATVMQGGRAVGEALVRLPFDHMFFTGSTRVGKKIMKAAADNMTSVTLELGGKSPTIVHLSADIPSAARKIIWGKFLNAGQTCIAPDHVFVHSRVFDEFVQQSRASLDEMYGTDRQIESHEDYADIVSQSHRDRLVSMLDEATQEGAILIAGARPEAQGAAFAPSLVTNVDWASRLLREEIFGPILPMVRFESDDEVISRVTSREKPLALYLFARDRKFVDRVLRETSSGGVCVNDIGLHFIHPDLPFGGVNASGHGKYHGHFGFQEFSNAKAVVKQRLRRAPINILHPPYDGAAKRLVRWLYRYYS